MCIISGIINFHLKFTEYPHFLQFIKNKITRKNAKKQIFISEI